VLFEESVILKLSVRGRCVVVAVVVVLIDSVGCRGQLTVRPDISVTSLLAS
jgi:hypothetical protein